MHAFEKIILLIIMQILNLKRQQVSLKQISSLFLTKTQSLNRNKYNNLFQ